MFVAFYLIELELEPWMSCKLQNDIKSTLAALFDVKMLMNTFLVNIVSNEVYVGSLWWDRDAAASLK